MHCPDPDTLFQTIETLVLLHSPSGAETEIDRWLLNRFQTLGVDAWQDAVGNVIARIPGRDASIAMKFGHVARAACLGFPTENTHGYEIAHLGAIANCIRLLQGFCQTDAGFKS